MRSAKCIVEIDLDKIRNNYRTLCNFCNGVQIASVVKANAYGLGVEFVAKVLQNEGCKDFFVASIDEGIFLRKFLGNTGNIFVFNGVFKDDVEEFYHNNLIPIINNLNQLEIWKEFASLKMKRLRAVLHIDTGVNRLGVTRSEIEKIIKEEKLLSGIDLCYIISHLASSEVQESSYNLEQLKKFKYYLKYFPEIKASLSNSSAVFLGHEYHFDLIRPGAALYGINSVKQDERKIFSNPVVLTAPIIGLQQLSKGDYIGYSGSFQTKRKTLVATLPLGYADGYSRSFSNIGEVAIDGQVANVVGRVSMDLITIDVTDIDQEKIFLGKRVEVIGDYCTPDRMASIMGTIGYEILTNIGNRYKKIYKNVD